MKTRRPAESWQPGTHTHVWQLCHSLKTFPSPARSACSGWGLLQGPSSCLDRGHLPAGAQLKFVSEYLLAQLCLCTLLVQNSAGRLFLGSAPALSSSPSRVFAVYAARWKRADRSQVPWRLSRGGTEAHHHNQPSPPLVLLPARGPSPCPGFTGGSHHAGSLALPLGAFQHRPDDGPVKKPRQAAASPASNSFFAFDPFKAEKSRQRLAKL